MDRERARQQANTLESDHIMPPRTSFRILDRDRPQKNNQSLNKSGADYFRSLGKQKIIRYQGPIENGNGNRLEPSKSAKTNQTRSLN